MYPRLGGACWLCLQGRIIKTIFWTTAKMKPASSSETLHNIYHSTRRHITEDGKS